jgi:predicted transcriptional regulator
MAETQNLESPAGFSMKEDEEPLAAIDESIQDARAGRTVSAEEVRQHLARWVASLNPRT